jgi:hypothetical protein
MLRRNILSISMALLILITSLTGAENFSRLSLVSFPGADKLVHMAVYFAFMSVIMFEHRYKLVGIGRLLFLALFPLCFGLIMELLQAWLTESRSGSWLDLLANIAGIALALLLSLALKKIRSTILR